MKTTNTPVRLLGLMGLAFVGGGVLTSLLGLTFPLSGPETPAASSAQVVPSPQLRDLMTGLSEVFEEAASRLSPSVVPIFAEAVESGPGPGGPEDPFREFFGDDFFKRFFGQPSQRAPQTIRSMGSGVIVSKEGYILTNNHVVAGAQKLTVVLEGGRRYPAKVIGTDSSTDLAVIQIQAENLAPAALGDSDQVRVGQWVIAVGNPFQLLHTVTAGIISAKGRSSVGLADYEDFIQTDASINPGNSGGALADLDGNVIGINTAISSPSGGSVGIGFAIPINMAKTVMEQLLSRGKVSRGYLGLLPQDIDEGLARALKLKGTKGALVGDVTSGGPADKAGILRGDVITTYDGKEVENSVDLRTKVAESKPGSQARIMLLRAGREMTVTATLGQRPEQGPERPGGLGGTPEPSHKLGLSVQDLTPDIVQQLGYENESGVVVAEVASGGPADTAGLQPGDLIKEVNRSPVRNTRDFARAISSLRSGESAAVTVRRGQNTFFVALEVP